jgi:hypothetical protein
MRPSWGSAPAFVEIRTRHHGTPRSAASDALATHPRAAQRRRSALHRRSGLHRRPGLHRRRSSRRDRTQTRGTLLRGLGRSEHRGEALREADRLTWPARRVHPHPRSRAARSVRAQEEAQASERREVPPPPGEARRGSARPGFEAVSRAVCDVEAVSARPSVEAAVPLSRAAGEDTARERRGGGRESV